MAASGTHGRNGGRIDRALDRLIVAGTRRWGTLAIPAAALLAVVFGVGFLAAPDRYAAAPFYAYAFRVLSMGPQAIGLIHLTVGVVVLARPGRPTTVAVLALNIVWAIISVTAIFQPNVSPTSFAYPLIFGVLLFLSVRSRGYDHATRR